MGRKNSRSRQARLQRKRNKRASARAGRQGGGGSGVSDQGGLPREVLEPCVILCCQALLASGQPLAGELLDMARMARSELGGPLGRIPLELHAFLFEGKPWTLTCDELAGLRRLFGQHNAKEVFERLWSLALTNEANSERFDERVEVQDCAHRAASAFEDLRACLDERKRSPTAALSLISSEARRHGNSARLCKAFEKLLRTALATVRATPAKLTAQLQKLGVESVEVFAMAEREEAEEAWWECGRIFLKEVLRRLQGLPGVTGSTAYAQLAKGLLEAPEAAVELARSGHTEPLASVHLSSETAAWKAFLERALDVGTLSFDERVRYQIARLKLLRAQALGLRDDEGPVRELLLTYQGLQNLLAHGVPPQARAIPAALASPLQDFYVDVLESLRCEGPAVRVTEELLRAHPEDFRLACLYATGALQQNEHFRLGFLAKCAPLRHVSPELFARSARTWSRTPRGGKAMSTLRERLFDPLNREDRKQCLIALSKQCLRRATGLRDYDAELADVLPYFPRDSFVLAELREQAALESSLVFLATMMAPLHSVKLTLTEEQSQQWLSYAREIARQSPLGAELVRRHLKRPSKWFTLAPAVLESASEFGDRKPRSETVVVTRAPVRPKPVKQARKKKGEVPRQQELFDGLDP